MCGICGVYLENKNISRDSIHEMNECLSHRGPDYGDTWVDGNIGLGHRRLSIIDLTSNGNQPMENANGQLIIVYNGEIYNFIELRKELSILGYNFRSNSDTEVILNGFDYWGADLFKKLNGIFALAIYNKQTKKLILARDRYGVKPLYYSFVSGNFVFASEIKSILKNKSIIPTLNFEVLHEFLFYGNELGESTLFRDIFKLSPGSYLELFQGDIEIQQFWKHEEMLPINSTINEINAITQTRVLFENAVQRQLISDVPVGIFLSGGVDSASIAAFASKHHQGKIHTFTAGFDFNGGHDEFPTAKKIANLYNTEHTEISIKGAELPHIIEKLVYQHDAPFSDAANIPLFLLAQEVKYTCKVILQGDGGDELFGGYRRYRMLSKLKYYRTLFKAAHQFKILLPKSISKQTIERFFHIFSEKDESRLFALLLTVETENESPIQILSDELIKKVSQSNPFLRYKILSDRLTFIDDKVQKMLWIDSMVILPNQFLEKVDKSTMASGVEVRVPFLDNTLSEFAMTLPASLKLKNGIGKYIFKKAMEGIVPNEVLYGPKKGFGVPYKNWLKGPLKQYFTDIVFSEYISSLRIFNYSKIEMLLQDHVNNKIDNGFLLWKLLNLCLWLKMYKVEIEQ